MRPLAQVLDFRFPSRSRPPTRSSPKSARSNSRTACPSQETLDKVYDHLDFTHAFEAFVNTVQGVGFQATHMGLLDAGVKDNDVVIFSELMDAKTLLLVANADTVYAIGILDLTQGPMVLEAPPKILGGIVNGWGRWVTDFACCQIGSLP